MRNKWLTVDCGWCAGAASPVAGTAISLLRCLGWAMLLVVGTLILTGVALSLTDRRPNTRSRGPARSQLPSARAECGMKHLSRRII